MKINRSSTIAQGTDLAQNSRDSFDLGKLLSALQAMRDGDFSVRLPLDWTGLAGKAADAFNDIVASNKRMAEELERVGTVVGKEGTTRQRARFDRQSGAWGDMETSVNTLIEDLLWPTREMTRAISAVAQGDLLQTVQLDIDGRPLQGEFLRSAAIVNTMIEQLADFTIAVASGDLSKKITVDVRGEILQLKEAINTMVDQLRSFASEVTRVAREVGTEGKLGGQAVVPGVAGTWKDL